MSDPLLVLSPLLFALGAFFTGLGVILLRNPYPAGSRTLGVAMLAVALWVGGAAAEPLVVGSGDLFATTRAIKYVGVCFLPALFFFFVARFALDMVLPPWAVVVVLAIPVASLALVLTNPLHELMWIHPPRAPGTGGARSPWGWWFLHVHSPAQYALALTALGVLVLEILQASTLRRAQSLVLFLGASVPLGVNVAYVLDPSLPDLQQTPLSFAFSALVFGWGFFRFRLFQVNPLAMRAVFDAVGDAVILVDGEGRVADLNPAARTLLSHRPTAAGRDPADADGWVGLPLARALTRAGIDPVDLADGDRTEVSAPDGRRLETVIHAVRDTRGEEVRGHVLMVRDVTRRRAFERRLAESEATLREVVARAPMGIVRLRPEVDGEGTPDFRCTLANPGAHELLSLEPGSLEGRSLREVAPPHTRRLLHLFARVLRTGEGEEVVLKVGFADDGAHWFQVSASAVGGDVSVTFMDITRERQRQQVVARQAHQDVLTGLLNRRGLELNGGRLLQRARATGGRVGLLFLDLDDFKQVNDRYGHARGDALLRAFAGRLRGCVRRGDVVARFGGDEFVVLVQVKEPADIREAANRIRELGRLPYRFEGASLTSAPSVGVAFLGADGGSLHELIRAADRDMYRVKKAGRS